MVQFRYQATDAQGRAQAGEIGACDVDEARRQLHERGLTVEQLHEVDAVRSSPAAGRLTAADAAEIVAQVAEIGKANLPMSIGLRAAAAESVNRRVRHALEHLADGTDRGQSLEDVLNANAGSFPPHVAGLIAAAAHTAQLGGALDELLDHQRQMREIRATVISAVLYPLLVVGMATVLLLFLLLDIVPIFAKMFEEFGLRLPMVTMALLQVSKTCIALTLGDQQGFLIGSAVALIAALLLIRFVSGAAAWRRFLGTAPLFGPIVAWSGAAAFAQMLSVLLEFQIPLPRALELTSDAVRDGNVRESCRRLAVGVAAGQTMADMLSENRDLPETLVPFVRSGEQQGDLAGALKLASQVFFERIGLRASLISSIAPPVIFVFIGLGIGFSIVALIMPLLTLIVGLA